ncbi:MAG: fatty acyl-AMP ligase, partial [Acidobacteria bacterium]|nr:fatty acyl-AMP ligase [Acidobacteriota bacterium]
MPEAIEEAARNGAGFFFVSPDGETFCSYAELRHSALRVASALRDAGLRRGDLVAIVLSDADEFLTTLFGASMAGVIPASLYPPATTSDLSRYLEMTTTILRASGARAVVTTGALAPAFESVRANCDELSLVLAREQLDGCAAEPDALPSLDDIAFVQFTSGSTSAPKGVALTHANVSANVDAFNGPAGVGTSKDDVAVSWLPLNHDMGLVGMAFGALYAARPCVLLPPHAFVKRPSEWLSAITRHGGSISFAPNFAYDLCVRRVKDRDMAGLDLSSWRVAGCGAEPIHPPTLAAFTSKFSAVGFRKTSFLPSYGLAEHVLAATFPTRGRLPRTEEVSADALTERRIAVPHKGEGLSVALVSCGKPLPEHRIRIVGEDGRPLPERHVGEILLAGPSVMLGYYRREALTAQTVRDGWLHTGDLGYLSEGELFVCGRAKDIIIVHGRKYHPQDLEWAVDGLPGVRRGRVVAFGATENGHADRVVIVAEPNGTVPSPVLTETIRLRIGDLFGLYVDDVALVPSGTVGRTT